MVTRKYLQFEYTMEVYAYLPEITNNGRLRRGAIGYAALRFGVNTCTVGRIRKVAQKSPAIFGDVQALKWRKMKRSHGPRTITIGEIEARILSVPILKRGTTWCT